MIDGKTFSNINDRLKMAKNSDIDFGGMKVVLCGDPRQLPPVGGKRLWGKVDGHDDRKTAHGLILYQSFTTVCQLLISRRQEANSYFAGLCDRIGEARMTKTDFERLKRLNE